MYFLGKEVKINFIYIFTVKVYWLDNKKVDIII